MESFYGGRPGASFVIVKTFNSIAEMNAAFELGTAYNEVYFDEYVNIYNPSSPEENGRVYRRGYNGAEYIGNITGPAGPATFMEFTPYDEITHENEITPIYGNNPEDVATSAIDNYEQLDTHNSIELIPGREETNNGQYKYNNNILYRYYNIENIDEETGKRKNIMKIGIKMPYPIFDFSVTPINSDAQLQIEKIDTAENKFFNQWNLKIPLARRGDSITKVSVLKVEDNNNSNIDYSFYSTNSVDQQNKKAQDRELERMILTCDITRYGHTGAENNTTTYYISDFEMITNVDITEQGYLVFTLPNGGQISSSQSILPIIKNIEIDKYGSMQIKWKNTDQSEGESTFEEAFKWIDDINYKDNGLEITWNSKMRDENGNIVYESDEITPKKETKLIPFGTDQRLITNIKFNEDNGILYETHLGLRKELIDVYTEKKVVQAEMGGNDIYNDMINNPNGTFHWLDMSNKDNLTWYKQIFDLKTMINNLVDERLKQKLPDSLAVSYGRGTTLDYISVDTQLKFQFSTKGPWYYNVIMDIELPNKVPSLINILQTSSKRKSQASDTIYSNNIIRKIYLRELDADILNDIYPQISNQNIPFSLEQAQETWQNLGYELFTEEEPCLDPWALSITKKDENNNNNIVIKTTEDMIDQYQDQTKKRLKYDYRFYTGQKFYYTSQTSSLNHKSYFSNSCAAAKQIFGLNNMPLKYYNLTDSSSKDTPGNSSEYFTIYNPNALYETFLHNDSYWKKFTESGYHYPRFWTGNDRIHVWTSESDEVINDPETVYEDGNGYHFEIEKNLPSFAYTLFNKILTGRNFTLPNDGTSIDSNMKNMISKITAWNIQQKDGKLYCYGPGVSGTSYSQFAGKTITVPVRVELANLQF